MGGARLFNEMYTEERAVRDALGPADRERRFEEDRWVAFALIGLNAGRAAI